jgi:hypothetical protein
VSLKEYLQDGDELKIVFANTIGEFREYIEKTDERYFLSDVELNDSYVIKEGDRIFKTFTKTEKISNESIEERSIALTKITDKIEDILEIIVNDERVILKNKDKYIFIDVFDFINFDLTRAKGTLVLILNGKKAGYYDALSKGDEVKIYWE